MSRSTDLAVWHGWRGAASGGERRARSAEGAGAAGAMKESVYGLIEPFRRNPWPVFHRSGPLSPESLETNRFFGRDSCHRVMKSGSIDIPARWRGESARKSAHTPPHRASLDGAPLLRVPSSPSHPGKSYQSGRIRSATMNMRKRIIFQRQIGVFAFFHFH